METTAFGRGCAIGISTAPILSCSCWLTKAIMTTITQPSKQWLDVKKSAKTDEEPNKQLPNMGFGKVKKLDSPQPLTPEEMQRIAMEEAKEKTM